MEKINVVCLTGHRPKSLPWGYNEENLTCRIFKYDLKTIFVNAIEYGVHTFLTGMAEGFDMIATEILLELRGKYKNIKVVAVLPCENQEIKWREKQQTRYIHLLKQCDEIIILNKEYTKTCMNDRNKYMVLHSEFCIACFNGKPSGTGNTIKFAKSNKCMVKIIDINKYY